MAASAQLQTPQPEAGGSAGDEKTTNWNTKKFREEYEFFKAKLIDQRFDPKQYPDPLLPRKTSDMRNNPKGSDSETERKLDQIIAEYNAKQL